MNSAPVFMFSAAAVPRRVLDALRDLAERLRVLDQLREARLLPERHLHNRRRRKALRRLGRGEVPGSILFVCQGNIYRSPYAAHAFQRALPQRLQGSVRVDSAGFVGPDRPCPDAAIEMARRNGIDLRDHRSSLVTPVRVTNAGLVVVMDPQQQDMLRTRFGVSGDRVLVLGDLDPLPIRTRTIRDPWNQPQEVLEDSYRRVDRCAGELVRALAEIGAVA